MARYLTPGKLSTLVLIEIHLLSDEPFSAGLLDVISSQLLSQSQSYGHGPGSRFSNTVDVATLSTSLQPLPSSLPGRTAFDFFLSQAWACVELDSLHAIFDRMHRLAYPDQSENRRVSAASPIGHYLRRCLVEWTRLQFADALDLLDAFRLWLEPTHTRWQRIDPESAARLSANDAVSGTITTPLQNRELCISSDDVEAALTHSIFVLQRMGQRMPADLKHEIYRWSRQLSAQSLVHFMAFYENWRAGEYTMALENLHRYFDYSLSANRGMEEPAGPRIQYQYALLHLSVLHADFERWQESVESMEECVITARENQDTPCLLFALSYLLHLRQIHPKTSPHSLATLTSLAGNGAGQDELDFLKHKAREGRHHSLATTTLLEEARLELRRSGVPPKSLECLLQASHLATTHGLHNLSASIAMFEGGIAERLGQQRLSVNAYDFVRSSMDAQCNMTDRVRASCRYAHQLAQKGLYAAAKELMRDLQPRVQTVPKLAQRVAVFTNLIALQQAVRSANSDAAEHYLTLLRPHRHSDGEVGNVIELLELECHIQTGDLTTVLNKINAQLDHARSDVEGDISHTLSLLSAKCSLFLAAKNPLAALSTTLRTIALAQTLHLSNPSTLFSSLAQLVQILIFLGEFAAAKKLGEAVLPFAVEAEASEVEAGLWRSMGEARVGLANPAISTRHDGSLVDTSMLAGALGCVDRAGGVSTRIQDSEGVLSSLIMRSRICAEMGNAVGKEEAELRVLDLLAEGKA